MKPAISVAIATFNEEKHLGECLESVSWADEVVVVDGTSADSTAKIAKQQKAKVFIVPNQPLMKKNMNLAFEKCSGDWILQLDADERITPELAQEIKKTVAGNPDEAAFNIPRQNLMLGKWLEHSGWSPDYQLRLFARGRGKYPAKNVHENLEITGRIGTLQNPIKHLNWETVSQFLLRLDSYTTYEANKLAADGRKITWDDAIKFPLNEFLRRFFAEKGYLDGLHGLVLSLLMAFYWEVIFAKVWEKEGFWPYGDTGFKKEVARQASRVAHDWRHWLMATENSVVRRYYLKLRNKL